VNRKFATEQEEFWAGTFGDEYSSRNAGPERIAANVSLFGRVLRRTTAVESIIEFGANIGLNLRALRLLLPRARLEAVEINAVAADILREWGQCEVCFQSILEFVPQREFDLVLIKGLLIHIDPEHLGQVYKRAYAASRKYICLVEYYSPVPVTVDYRGHADRLFKRDFAGEMLDEYPDLSLVDYGFCYHRDANFAQDDVTWFLLKKR
jgi:spore coat polysaccharide biosynthesis protein SpsF